MNVVADLFFGFAEHPTPTDGAEIFVRTGGCGPPLLHWCTKVSAAAVIFLADENPQATLAALVPFLKAHPGSG
jgi:hypothetical protein